MKNYITTIFIILFFFLGCVKEKNNSTFIFDKESIELVSLKSDSISIREILNPFDILYSNDLLFISLASGNNLFLVYDLFNNKVRGEYIGKGRGPQELLGIQSISKNAKQNTLTLYDAITSKYIVCSIPDLEKDSLYIIKSGEAKLNPYKEQVLYTNDSSITYLGLETRLVSQNSVGQKIGSFGDYKIYNNNEKEMWIHKIYKAQIAYNEKTNQFAIFDRLTDKVEFYNDQKLTKVVSGPDSFKEEYKIISTGGGYALGHYRDKTRIAYGCVVSNSKSIFALYSGETFGNDGIHHNTIIQFDWNGNPVRIYNLDIPVNSFDVDWTHKIIYGLNTENTPIILKFQMK
jgi:hypothetical protein